MFVFAHGVETVFSTVSHFPDTVETVFSTVSLVFDSPQNEINTRDTLSGDVSTVFRLIR